MKRKVTETLAFFEHRNSFTDDHGGATDRWIFKGMILPIWEVAPGGSDTIAGTDTRVVTKPTIYAPVPPFGIKNRDRVTVNGDTWEIDGNPQPWRFRKNEEDRGIVISIKRVEGV